MAQITHSSGRRLQKDLQRVRIPATLESSGLFGGFIYPFCQDWRIRLHHANDGLRFGCFTQKAISYLSEKTVGLLNEHLVCIKCRRHLRLDELVCPCGRLRRHRARHGKLGPDFYLVEKPFAQQVSEALDFDDKKLRRKERERFRKNVGKLPTTLARELWRIQSGKCYFCMSELGTFERHQFHIDHLTPAINGGLSDLKNSALLCRHCNLWKSCKNESEFWPAIRKHKLWMYAEMKLLIGIVKAIPPNRRFNVTDVLFQRQMQCRMREPSNYRHGVAIKEIHDLVSRWIKENNVPNEIVPCAAIVSKSFPGISSEREVSARDVLPILKSIFENVLQNPTAIRVSLHVARRQARKITNEKRLLNNSVLPERTS